MFLEKKVDPKSNGLKILIPQKQCRNFEKLCTKFVGFCSLIHRAGPPQIQTPQGFPPGGTSSASQARHLLLGRRLSQKRWTKFQVTVYEIRCFFVRSFHLIGQPQIPTSPSFPPGVTSSVSLRLPPSPRERLWVYAKLRKPFSSGKALGLCKTAKTFSSGKGSGFVQSCENLSPHACEGRGQEAGAAI
jgi:hypothetical protein